MPPSPQTPGQNLIAWTTEPLPWTTSLLNPEIEDLRTFLPRNASASFTQA
jgi:hypothetical protein